MKKKTVKFKLELNETFKEFGGSICPYKNQWTVNVQQQQQYQLSQKKRKRKENETNQIECDSSSGAMHDVISLSDWQHYLHSNVHHPEQQKQQQQHQEHNFIAFY